MERDISRRTVLGAGAAVTGAFLAAAAAQPAGAAVRATAAAPSPRLEIGANAGWFTAVQAAVPAATCRRVYYPEYNYVPPSWPSGPSVSRAMVSIRPVPADLLAGRLDAQIRTFLASAPAGSDLTTWHEAGNLAGYPSYITPATMRRVHTHMQRLCQRTNVRYGPILCMRPSSMPPWLVPGMDWYGLDIYDWPEFHFPHGPLDVHGRLYPRLNQWRAVIRHVSRRRYPVLSICETNSSHRTHRPKWFAALSHWLSENGGRSLLTYWNDDPKAVGPWLPHDQAVIRALRHATTLPRLAAPGPGRRSIGQAAGSVRSCQSFRASADRSFQSAREAARDLLTSSLIATIRPSRDPK
jgi:hypothetical protein